MEVPARCADCSHFAACSSAAAASARNKRLRWACGSAAATWRYSQADSFSWYQLVAAELPRAAWGVDSRARGSTRLSMGLVRG